jgi:hypothetical protein
MPRRLSALAFALFTAAVPAAAGSPVVVELFTSQGCSSCPPADALLAEITQRPDVIALALHVDYWDYLGWQDSFASPAFTKRQRSYAKALGERMVYTPQIVVNGRRGVIGSRRDEVEAAIAEAHGAAPVAVLTLETTDEGLVVTIAAAGERPAAAVSYVLFAPPQTVEISRGENRGRSLDYHNVVRSWMMLDDWTGQARRWVLPLPQEARGAVVLVQDRETRAILGAAQHLFDGPPRPE